MRPGRRWGEGLPRSPRFIARFKGAVREGGQSGQGRREVKGKKRGEKKGRGMGWDGILPPYKNSCGRPCMPHVANLSVVNVRYVNVLRHARLSSEGQHLRGWHKSELHMGPGVKFPEPCGMLTGSGQVAGMYTLGNLHKTHTHTAGLLLLFRNKLKSVTNNMCVQTAINAWMKNKSHDYRN